MRHRHAARGPEPEAQPDVLLHPLEQTEVGELSDRLRRQRPLAHAQLQKRLALLSLAQAPYTKGQITSVKKVQALLKEIEALTPTSASDQVISLAEKYFASVRELIEGNEKTLNHLQALLDQIPDFDSDLLQELKTLTRQYGYISTTTLAEIEEEVDAVLRPKIKKDGWKKENLLYASEWEHPLVLANKDIQKSLKLVDDIVDEISSKYLQVRLADLSNPELNDIKLNSAFARTLLNESSEVWMSLFKSQYGHLFVGLIQNEADVTNQVQMQKLAVK